MYRDNPLRRFRRPSSASRTALLELADEYPADQTGFSWFEFPDDTVAIGCRLRRRRPPPGRRFLDVGRRYMVDTGGPTQFWNIRREFQPTPSTRRELYYSPAIGGFTSRAPEGWIRVGYLAAAAGRRARSACSTPTATAISTAGKRILPAPRTRCGSARSADPRARDLPHDWKELQKIFTQELLPEALEANEKLMAAMRLVDQDFKPADYLVKALTEAGFDTEKLYVENLIRESQYLALREVDEAKRASAGGVGRQPIALGPGEDLPDTWRLGTRRGGQQAGCRLRRGAV